eukprot:PLAT10595.1.p2 GENE.PLAT10595.1~~PLAT10595.1.p2  ORF type:complete len:209 (-),score=86.35 PLAT10595.1:144-770(-)
MAHSDDLTFHTGGEYSEVSEFEGDGAPKGAADLPLMPAEGPMYMFMLHYEAFDSRCDEELYQHLWAYAEIIRNRVFVKDLGYPYDDVFDSLDSEARHIIALIGDAPIGCARWRLVMFDEHKFAQLDNLCILPSHRGYHNGKELLSHTVRDIAEQLEIMGQSIDGVLANCPNDDTAVALFQQFGFQAIGELVEEGSHPFYRMLLPVAAE